MGFNGDLYPDNATSVLSTKGDIVRYNTERERYGIGSAGQVLQVASSLPTWSTINLADSVLTTQGDVLYEGASALARLGQSTNNYTLATKGSGANPAWQASATSTMSGTGDVLYSSGANTLARLAIGSTDDVLTVAGGVPTWASAGGGGGAWTNLGEDTLGSAGDTMSITSLARKDYLHIVGVAIADSGSPQCALSFNGEEDEDYSFRFWINDSTDYTGVNQDVIKLNDAYDEVAYFNIDVMNYPLGSGYFEKQVYSETGYSSSTGAGNYPALMTTIAKWINTTDAIDQVDIKNIDTGDFAIGSNVTVFGADRT